MAKKNRFLCELYCNDTQTRQSAVSTFDQWAQCPVQSSNPVCCASESAPTSFCVCNLKCSSILSFYTAH